MIPKECYVWIISFFFCYSPRSSWLFRCYSSRFFRIFASVEKAKETKRRVNRISYWISKSWRYKYRTYFGKNTSHLWSWTYKSQTCWSRTWNKIQINCKSKNKGEIKWTRIWTLFYTLDNSSSSSAPSNAERNLCVIIRIDVICYLSVIKFTHIVVVSFTVIFIFLFIFSFTSSSNYLPL